MILRQAGARLRSELHCSWPGWLGVLLYGSLAWAATGTSCLLDSSIGLPCPGCGLTRGFLYALHGDLPAAWAMHPLFWLAPLILFGVAALAVFAPGRITSPRWRKLWIGLAILFLLVYAWRMICFFPARDPLDWNADAFLIRLFRGAASLWRMIIGQGR